MSQRSELSKEDRALSYSKYYDLPITPIPEEKLAILKAGPMDPKQALPIEKCNDLFIPGYSKQILDRLWINGRKDCKICSGRCICTRFYSNGLICTYPQRIWPPCSYFAFSVCRRKG